jgi:transposase
LIDVAQAAPQTVILAEDEARLYLQPTTTAVWAPKGQTPVVRSDPGRSKTNFYGTRNLHSGAEIVTRAAVMNGEATALHLEAILKAIPDRPILLLWDRAPWHRGPAIRALLAANPRLEIMVLPVAAPEVNPQEHVWKATRRAVSHNHRCRELTTLADRFEAYLTSHTFASSLLDCYGFNAIRPIFA